jgi:hypothetical protein
MELGLILYIFAIILMVIGTTSLLAFLFFRRDIYYILSIICWFGVLFIGIKITWFL